MLVALAFYVIWFMPGDNPTQKKYWVQMHQGLRNFLIAKKMIAGLLTTRPTRWSGPIKCGMLGRGVWYAEGVVGLESSTGAEAITPWKAIFIPETSQALYLAVGTQYQGDFNEAVRSAGLQPRNP